MSSKDTPVEGFMILFHGTIEEYIKNIKKDGLQSRTSDQWLVEIAHKNVLCLSSEPTSGEGGSPIYFAGRHKRAKTSNGYLVVISIPQKNLLEKLICVFDNKVLDNYVRYHFFVREEYRNVGYPLFVALRDWKQSHPSISLDEANLISGPTDVEEQELISSDQHTYPLDLGIKPQIHNILGITVSSFFVNFIKQVGLLEHFYHFSELHYAHIQPEKFQKFHSWATRLDNITYWQEFYRQFPQPIAHSRDMNIQEWFSSQWLAHRKSPQIHRDCQLLLGSIDPQYIVGFLQVTNGSNILPIFRPRKPEDAPKYTMAQRIWRQVNRMLDKK